MKEKVKKVKKIKIFLILFLLSSAVACTNEEKKLELNTDKINFELGSDVKLDVSKILKTKDKEVLDKAIVNFEFKDKDVNVEKNKSQSVVKISGLSAGTYKGNIEYKKQKLDFAVIVKDTVAPKFVDFKNKIEIQQNQKDVDYASFFTADDLSSVKIAVDSSGVDLSKSGEYAITVTATDEHENKTEKKSTVVVKEKVEESAEEASENEQVQTESTNGTASTAGNTQTTVGSTNGGGSVAVPAPTPQKQIVRLHSFEPLEEHREFNTEDEAWNWAESVWLDRELMKSKAESFGYEYKGSAGFTVVPVYYGYEGTMWYDALYEKYSVVWRFE